MNPTSPNAPLHPPLCSGEPHGDADRRRVVIIITEGVHQNGIRRASR
jgi:hypothetical protein